MLALDANDNLYIGDFNNDLIHKVTVNAAVAGSVISTPVNSSGVFTYESSFPLAVLLTMHRRKLRLHSSQTSWHPP